MFFMDLLRFCMVQYCTQTAATARAGPPEKPFNLMGNAIR